MKEGWTFTPFEDVCVSMTKGPFGSDIKKSLYVPKSADTYKVYIQVNAIEKDASLGEYFISKEYFNSKMSRFEVKPNDYIITCDGTLGRYLRLPPTMERGIISASLLRITLKTNILPRFFEYLWDGYIMSRLTSDIRNSALVHLPSATKIGKVLIPLPSIAEQEHIVAELDLLQGIIDKQKAQLKELDTLAQSLFYDMFGDPVENEKGWEIKTIGETCTIKGRIGFRGYTREDLVEEGEGAITLSPSNIVNDALDLTKCSYISWYKYEESPEIKIFEGDIIYAKTASIGKVALVRHLPCEATINPQFIVLKNINCDKEFLLGYLKSAEFKALANTIVRGVAIPTLSQANFALLPIPVPPLTLQQSFATKVKAIEHQKASINASIAETQKLFDYTMDKYFG